MSQETLGSIMQALDAGLNPVLRMSVRRGKDSRLIKVVWSDNYRFYCVYADTSKEEPFTLSHSSVKYGTFALTEVR
jgi:hypothetical protein